MGVVKGGGGGVSGVAGGWGGGYWCHAEARGRGVLTFEDPQNRTVTYLKCFGVECPCVFGGGPRTPSPCPSNGKWPEIDRTNA